MVLAQSGLPDFVCCLITSLVFSDDCYGGAVVVVEAGQDVSAGVGPGARPPHAHLRCRSTDPPPVWRI